MVLMGYCDGVKYYTIEYFYSPVIFLFYANNAPT
jgi:hypothetical protein